MDKIRILVIDDELPILMTVSLILELEPEFEVRTLQNVNGWKEVLLDFRPDVLLIDYRMPEITGEDLIRMMDEAGLRKNIRLVVLFSATPLSTEEVRRIGADRSLEKPFDADQLVSVIRSHLAYTPRQGRLAA
jgi:DNA-binding response OmpR family regulator